MLYFYNRVGLQPDKDFVFCDFTHSFCKLDHFNRIVKNARAYYIWGLYHKTYYGRKLRHFIISLSICHWQPFPVHSNVCGQVQEPSKRGAPARCFTWVGSCLTCKHKTRLEKLARNKRSSLFWKVITYNIGHWGLYYKTFYGSNCCHIVIS